MKNVKYGVVILCLLGLGLFANMTVGSAATLQDAASVQSQAYRLAKYDVIQIAILGLDESSFKNIMVGPDGYVNLPYVGTAKLAGLTVPEATEFLRAKLGEYIKIPGMTVMVSEYGPRKIYVLGEVKSPGVYKLAADNLNIIAALSSAGGIGLKGRPKHVEVLREIEGKVSVTYVNFDKLVEQADLSQNAALQDGDLVYVPKSGKIDLNADILPIISVWSMYKALN